MQFNSKIGAALVVFLFGLMVVAGMSQGAMAQVQQSTCFNPSYNLRYGSSDYTTGGAVSQMQSLLSSQGYFNSAYLGTGRFGSITLQAVVQFQAAHGLPATGYFGPMTRALVQQITCGTSVTPTPTNTLSVYSVSPTSAAVGTTVTITGSGFTSNNTVLMDGNIAAQNVPVTSSYAIPVACSPFASSCGGGARQTIAFTIPSTLSPYCAAGMMCAQYMRQVTPGTYSVSVLNSNGTSNTITFAVTGTTVTPSGAVSLYVANPSSAAAGTSVTLGAIGLTQDNTILIDGMVAAQHVSIINTFVCIPDVTCNTNHQALIFTVPTYLSINCATGQACPALARMLAPGTYSLAIQNANGTSNSIPFTITGGAGNNQQLSISGLSAPASLSLGQQGTWTVNAVSNGAGNLHYSVVWGDEQTYFTTNGVASSPVSTLQSSATFTHVYSRSSTFNPVFTVTNDSGQSVSASNTITVTPLYIN